MLKNVKKRYATFVTANGWKEQKGKNESRHLPADYFFLTFSKMILLLGMLGISTKL